MGNKLLRSQFYNMIAKAYHREIKQQIEKTHQDFILFIQILKIFPILKIIISVIPAIRYKW
jgi:hypothetical protein